jgi:hypothetical protein
VQRLGLHSIRRFIDVMYQSTTVATERPPSLSGQLPSEHRRVTEIAQLSPDFTHEGFREQLLDGVSGQDIKDALRYGSKCFSVTGPGARS